MFAILCAVVNKVFDLAPPLLVGWFIDTANGDPPEFLQGVSEAVCG